MISSSGPVAMPPGSSASRRTRIGSEVLEGPMGAASKAMVVCVCVCVWGGGGNRGQEYECPIYNKYK